MLDRSILKPKRLVSFGPFQLSVTERLVTKDGRPLHVGGRALDILIVLIEQPGEVISKKNLMARVWPDITVDEGSLRFHVAALRKAIGDGKEGARYVTNVPGRGYCFVAQVSHVEPETTLPATEDGHQLPPRLTRMVGRDEVVRTLSQQLATRRFVTVIGPGGIGKTTVAIWVAHVQLNEFGGAIGFVDLGPLQDPLLVPSALASVLGLTVQSTDPVPSLLGFLRQKRLLLVLDGCEHVIDAAAGLAERIFQGAPGVHILATSREPFRVEGEHVYRLAPLDSPPRNTPLTMPEVLSFPAAQLFVERVTAGGHLQKVSEADATLIGGICGKLDGIPLAIELVAGRAQAYGFSGTAALLDNRLRLLWQGRRTAPPRHRTLTATLDWSYNLLTEVEREVLCRLSIFAGTFTLEAVQSVVPGENINRPDVTEALASLVAKSLVALESNDPATRYRLLDTTRTYLLEKLTGRGGRDDVARRLATFVREALQHARGKASDLSKTQKVAAYAGLLDNTRAALQYAFASGGDPKQSVIMAAEAAPLFLELSLLTECHHWSQKGIEALDDSTRGTPFELELQAALAFSAMFTGGNSDDVRVKFSRGLELAETLQDLYNEMRLLGGLHIILHRIGDFVGALELAQRSMAVATQIGDPAAIAIAHSMLGVAQHLAGDHANARINCEAALKLPSSSPHINKMNFGFDQRNRVQILSARNFWLQGFPDKAVDAARRTIAEATALRHPATLGISLIWTVPVFLWIGDWRSADDHVEQLMTIAGQHSFAVHQAFGLGLRGELSVKRGEAKIGIELLRGSLEALHKSNYEMRTTGLTSALAEGMAMAGRLDEALQTIDAAIARVERAGDHFYMPELLRLKGGILAAANGTDLAIVEACLAESLDLARRQSALGWELRSATSLARWLRSQGRLEGSRQVLAPVYERFTEGFETADLRAAREVLGRTQ